MKHINLQCTSYKQLSRDSHCLKRPHANPSFPCLFSSILALKKLATGMHFILSLHLQTLDSEQDLIMCWDIFFPPFFSLAAS